MRLIIDTDAGVDDAQAILMALQHPAVTIEAITTVTGNVHVNHVNRNIFTILDLMQRDIPVYQGADQPLIPGFWEPEERIHGADGLGDYKNRPVTARSLEAEHASVALVRMANEAPGQLTLVALGPLTNIALACRLDRTFPLKIKQFVFMGGTISALGNTPNITAEFNHYCDPEAAMIALAAFPESSMLSWETTLKHPFTWDQYDALTRYDTVAARFFTDTTQTTVDFLRGFPSVPGYLLPDPLAMAVALEPGLIAQDAFHYVTVELQGLHTRGQTVIDYMDTTRRDPNVHVVTGVDIEGVYYLYEQMLS